MDAYHCGELHSRIEVNGVPLVQPFPNKWTTNNEMQYSYGWLGVKYQSTSNLILMKGGLLVDEGRSLVSDLENTGNCSVQAGEWYNENRYCTLECD
ncbi:hypothetical protein ACH3XW_8700 [Acanthocheilonema viteae]